eukprot:364871-Chlamydomonas_euryale.AAC.11
MHWRLLAVHPAPCGRLRACVPAARLFVLPCGRLRPCVPAARLFVLPCGRLRLGLLRPLCLRTLQPMCLCASAAACAYASLRPPVPVRQCCAFVCAPVAPSACACLRKPGSQAAFAPAPAPLAPAL